MTDEELAEMYGDYLFKEFAEHCRKMNDKSSDYYKEYIKYCQENPSYPRIVKEDENSNNPK